MMMDEEEEVLQSTWAVEAMAWVQYNKVDALFIVAPLHFSAFAKACILQKISIHLCDST